MKRYLLSATMLLVASCASVTDRLGVQENAGFFPVPFPNNSYAPGQIVEIFTKPEKISITYQPSFLHNNISCESGWNVSRERLNTTKANINAKIKEIISGEAEYGNKYTTKIEFDNTKICYASKNNIREVLKKDITNNVGNIRDNLSFDIEYNGRKFDVVTQVLKAKFKLATYDETGKKVNLKFDVLEKINAAVSGGLEATSSDKGSFTGEDIVVGIHTDPTMTKSVLIQTTKKDD